MSKNTTHITKPSALDNFGLAFEYDKTWTEAKKHVKERTL